MGDERLNPHAISQFCDRSTADKYPSIHRPEKGKRFLVGPFRPGNGDEGDNFVVCQVCGDTDADVEDPIVYCDGCNMTTHALCYGAPLHRSIPKGSWFCELCRAQKREEEKRPVSKMAGLSSRISASRPAPKCALCPMRAGPMKRTTDWQWAHIACALYIPECFFYDCDAREPVDVTCIPHCRKDLECYICEQKHGATVECAEQGCPRQFHVTCAQRKGLYLNFRDFGGKAITWGFCKDHPKKEKFKIVPRS